MSHHEPTDTHPAGASRQESQDGASPSSVLGLNYSSSPKATPKSVSIAPHADVVSPLILGGQKGLDEFELDIRRSPRKASVKGPGSRRPTSRLSYTSSPMLRPNSALYANSDHTSDKTASQSHLSETGRSHLADRVSEWIKSERMKRFKKKREKREGQDEDQHVFPQNGSEGGFRTESPKRRRGSGASEDSYNLDKLEDIIKQSLHIERRPSRKSSLRIGRKGSIKRLTRKSSSLSSEPDQFESDIQVPSSDVVLDNSRTLSYTGGASDESEVSSSDELQQTTSYRDQDSWAIFKFEIVRLTHTLRLKSWRKVPMSLSNEISVQRLSGALTNAVYVVSPPTEIPSRRGRGQTDASNPAPQKLPPKLLLRIYGPQVGHLIDRESELAILRRLARKNIGPRLLGTFANGRFEEYLHAKPLTPDDLRNSDTSRQIAKRMRELHEGIDLLDKEREDGPFVWRNWNKWEMRVGQIVTWLDSQIMKVKPNTRPSGAEAWKRRGFICGVPWQQFKETVEKYRAWLESQYGGSKGVREQLVFAHNDTQYGNILRLVPTGESPLLLPANTHKQLVVIDFEYANANVPGLEFANHFTEWCYNYHDARRPYAFHPTWYPTREEQDRFFKAYISHRPQLGKATPKMAPDTPIVEGATPGEMPSRKPTSSISSFMLDARAPSQEVTPQLANRTAEKSAEDEEAARLWHETRIWRLANTAQWVAWGIVQAKVPGMPDFDATDSSADQDDDDEESKEEQLAERGDEYRDLLMQQEQAVQGGKSGSADKEEADDEFDYLGYAQHRALFFWADAIQLGLVKAEELPEGLTAKLKNVPY